MNPILWYILVLFDVVFLILSFLTKNIYFAIACLFLAIYLDRFTKTIPFPKAFEKLNVVHIKDNFRNKHTKE
jgi:hypothetical protein